MTNRPKSNLRSVLLTICGSIVLVTAVVTGAFIAHRYTQILVERAGGSTMVAIWSPVGIFHVVGNGRSLTEAVYPGSVAIEMVNKDFFHGPSGHEAKFGELNVLRFSTTADTQTLREWYRKWLGSGFTECVNWPCGDPFRGQRWAGIVNDPAVSPIATFQQKLEDRIRGVQLTKKSSSPEIIISLYDLQLP